MIYMENRIKNRFYLLYVEQDIFDTWCLIRTFGSLTGARRRTIRQVCSSSKQAWSELTEIEYKKRQRGYVYADVDHNVNHFQLRPQNLFEITISKPLIRAIKQDLPIKIIDPNQMELILYTPAKDYAN